MRSRSVLRQLFQFVSLSFQCFNLFFYLDDLENVFKFIIKLSFPLDFAINNNTDSNNINEADGDHCNHNGNANN